MSDKTPLLTLILEGRPLRSGRIPVSLALELLSGLQKVLYRTGQVILGDTDSSRKGPKPKHLKRTMLELDLVEVTHGSPLTVLRFEKSSEIGLFPETDELFRIIETALEGIRQLQLPHNAPPPECDRGILLAWRDLGRLFLREVSSITFELNHRPEPLRVEYTPRGFRVIQQHIQSLEVSFSDITTVEGRLLMADFKEEEMRLRVHPLIGDPIVCDFDEEQKEEVLENLLHWVCITGKAVKDSASGKINRVHISDIEPLEDFSGPIEEGLIETAYGFWAPRTVEELARTQGVEPMADVKVLWGTWPGSDEDGFEDFVRELRRKNSL